jgi:hypothetical protein
LALVPILNDDRGPKSMKTPVSLIGLSAAIMLFVIGVVMHEAARADRSTVPGISHLADSASGSAVSFIAR